LRLGASRFQRCRSPASQAVVVVRSRRRVGTRLIQPPTSDFIGESIKIEYRDMHCVTFVRAGFFDEIPPAVPAFEMPQRFSRDLEAPSPGRSPLVRQPEVVHCQTPLLERRRLPRSRLPGSPVPLGMLTVNVGYESLAQRPLEGETEPSSTSRVLAKQALFRGPARAPILNAGINVFCQVINQGRNRGSPSARSPLQTHCLVA